MLARVGACSAGLFIALFMLAYTFRAEDSASRVVVPECLEEAFSSIFHPVRHLHPCTSAQSLSSIFESRANDDMMQWVLGIGMEHLRHPLVLQLTKDV